MKNKSENRRMNAYFCASTFCFPLPKPLPLPLVLVLPASLIATGGLGFPVFLFEDARILFFFFFKCVTSSFYLLLFAFLRRSFIRSLVFTIITEEQKKPKRATNARRMPLFLNHTTLSTQRIIKQLNKDRRRGDKSVTTNNLFLPPLLRVFFVLLKECAEQTRIPSSSHVRLLRNGDLFP